MTITMNGAYFNGLDQSGLQTALGQIPGSTTTDYILFSLNVASDTSADINFGLYGPVLATNGQATAETGTLLSALVQAGVKSGTCRRVWLSLGGAGSNAFANIQTMLDNGSALGGTLIANFAAIISQLAGIEGVETVGFDMDYEQSGSELASQVTAVTVALYRHFKSPITFCPFTDSAQWVQALQQVYAALGTQPVVGINLQTYAGGYGNDPKDWADAIAQAGNTGVSNPSAFIWPIVSCDPDAEPGLIGPPDAATAALKKWGSTGGSLWATAALPYQTFTLANYGTAIATGIG